MSWRDRISVDRMISHGRVCTTGTRVLVSVVFDNLAAGESPQNIAAAYQIADEDFRAAVKKTAAIGRP